MIKMTTLAKMGNNLLSSHRYRNSISKSQHSFLLFFFFQKKLSNLRVEWNLFNLIKNAHWKSTAKSYLTVQPKNHCLKNQKQDTLAAIETSIQNETHKEKKLKK